MANFDVLSGRLLLDTTDFVRSLQQASSAAQLFTQRLGVSLQSARRDLDQLSASQARFAASAQAWSRRGAAAPWSALFAGPAAAFNSPSGNTSQAALMGFVERVNQSLSRQAGLADQLTEAVDRVRIAVEERARPGREIHDQFKEAADTVVELLKKAGELIEGSLEKVVDKAREAAEQLGELNDKLGELADKSKEAAEKVDGLNDKLKDFAEKCESAADKLEELGKKLENAFASKFTANGAASGFVPNGGAGVGGWLGGAGGWFNSKFWTNTAGMSPQQKARAKSAKKIVDKEQAHEHDLRNQGINLGNAFDQWAKRFDTLTPQQQKRGMAQYAATNKRHSRSQIMAVRAATRKIKPGSRQDRAQLQKVVKQMEEKYRASDQFAERARQAMSAGNAAEAKKWAEASAKARIEADKLAGSLMNSATANDNAATAVRKGTKVRKDSIKVTERATQTTKKLGDAEQDAAKKLAGEQTPKEQAEQQQQQSFTGQVQNWWNQQVQQGVQQFQQNMQQAGQQAMQQAGQQAWDSGQAMLEQAIDGPQQVQAMIDQAVATGHKSDAIRLIRQRLEAQLEQSKINLHGLATNLDPNAGSFGSMPGVSNEAYLMTLDIPLVRLIKFLQSQLAHLPKMAAGGIVSGATAAVVGEAGPEAVLPLSSFANMLGSLPVFSNINSAMESISDSLAGQGRTGEANRWDQMLDRVQSSFDYVSHFVENARRIDLRPQGMLRPLTQGMLMDQEMARHPAYRIGGLSTGDLALHFHGVDISNAGAARQFAQQLLPALELEARSLGQDMTGRSVFRSPSMTGPGTPGRPYGFAR